MIASRYLSIRRTFGRTCQAESSGFAWDSGSTNRLCKMVCKSYPPVRRFYRLAYRLDGALSAIERDFAVFSAVLPRSLPIPKSWHALRYYSFHLRPVTKWNREALPGGDDLPPRSRDSPQDDPMSPIGYCNSPNLSVFSPNQPAPSPTVPAASFSKPTPISQAFPRFRNAWPEPPWLTGVLSWESDRYTTPGRNRRS